jgi:hypothetical protein
MRCKNNLILVPYCERTPLQAHAFLTARAAV